jgi:hypothetical protein
MVGHDAVVAAGEDVRAPRAGGRVVAGLGLTAVLAVTAALLVALLHGTASAQSGSDPGPQPYGGALEQVDPANQITSEQVLEVGMLALGSLNGVAFAIAMIASRLRGPTTAQTRRALITRTGAGTVSESRRERRERRRRRAPEAPSADVAPGPVAPEAGAAPAGGPRSLVPRTPPAGAVPAQGGPAPREGLVPAGRAPRGPQGPDPRARQHPPVPSPVPGHPVSPPTDLPASPPPAVRR